MRQNLPWEIVGAAKRDALLASIPPEWVIPAHIFPPESQLDVTTFPEQSGWFSPVEIGITSTAASEILANIAAGVWTAEEVTRAFCKRAAAAHQLVSPSLQSQRRKTDRK